MNYGTLLRRLYPEGVVSYQVETASATSEDDQKEQYRGYSMTIQLPLPQGEEAESTPTEQTQTGGDGQ